jgi:hypothetical protein
MKRKWIAQAARVEFRNKNPYAKLAQGSWFEYSNFFNCEVATSYKTKENCRDVQRGEAVRIVCVKVCRLPYKHTVVCAILWV